MTVIDCLNKEVPVIDKLRAWLGGNGISFFRKVKETYGRVDAIWMEGEFNDGSIQAVLAVFLKFRIPHVVHLQEGMQVRNFLRTIYGTTWTDHEYDDRWASLIEEAIKGADNGN